MWQRHVQFACNWRLNSRENCMCGCKSHAEFASAGGHNTAKKPLVFWNDAGRAKYLNKKMGTQHKTLIILRGNSAFRGLSNNIKHGPLQTHETVTLRSPTKEVPSGFFSAWYCELISPWDGRAGGGKMVSIIPTKRGNSCHQKIYFHSIGEFHREFYLVF
jgi:hypothetical protein